MFGTYFNLAPDILPGRQFICFKILSHRIQDPACILECVLYQKILAIAQGLTEMTRKLDSMLFSFSLTLCFMKNTGFLFCIEVDKCNFCRNDSA